MQFFDALNLMKGDIIAIAGGGGKTSLMYALGRETLSHGLRPILTTTTKILPPEDCQLVVCSGISPEGKLLGLEAGAIPLLLKVGADVVLVEADGSAGLPFKAPGPHEPVIPTAATVVVTVVGIDCIGKPLLAEYVHRPELVEKLTGLQPGQLVTTQVVAQVLTHPQGYGGKLPAECRRLFFINKIENPDQLKLAREIYEKMHAIITPAILPCRLILGAAQLSDPVLQLLDL